MSVLLLLWPGDPLSPGADRPLRADEPAKVAAHTFFGVEHGVSAAVEPDGLVTAVGAGDGAAAAADALLPMEPGQHERIALKNVRGLTDGGKAKAAHLVHGINALFG